MANRRRVGGQPQRCCFCGSRPTVGETTRNGKAGVCEKCFLPAATAEFYPRRFGETAALSPSEGAMLSKRQAAG